MIPRLRACANRARPYWLHLYLLVYTPTLLFLDGRFRAFWPQCGLGAATVIVLWCCTRYLSRPQRRQVWACVVVATGFEVFGSLIWGLYRYRLGNIPLYVPPGHGLVYFFGLTAGGLPVFQRHARRAAIAVLAGAGLYALAGLTVLPVFTHRLDVLGAACFPILAWCVLSTPRYALFAAIFVATLDLELAGTWAGDWTWLPVSPWDHVAAGNPPSAIAGGYCVIDGTVLLLTSPVWGRWLSQVGGTLTALAPRHSRLSTPPRGTEPRRPPSRGRVGVTQVLPALELAVDADQRGQRTQAQTSP